MVQINYVYKPSFLYVIMYQFIMPRSIQYNFQFEIDINLMCEHFFRDRMKTKGLGTHKCFYDLVVGQLLIYPYWSTHKIELLDILLKYNLIGS